MSGKYKGRSEMIGMGRMKVVRDETTGFFKEFAVCVEEKMEEEIAGMWETRGGGICGRE